MMLRLILELLVIFVLTAIGSFLIGTYIVQHRAADGMCIRGDDGEVYLKLSELAQKKLADPSTDVLILRVVDVSTRNKQPL